mmetsp:Transcript_31533/g.62351  ORF Transcript_31533/g.62351 Transcript_31533/m.62351 type:complete len:92 (+) Transcript_31533:265-540(+)
MHACQQEMDDFPCLSLSLFAFCLPSFLLVPLNQECGRERCMFAFSLFAIAHLCVLLVSSWGVGSTCMQRETPPTEASIAVSFVIVSSCLKE